ncbi:MAG: heme lyase CcmF/NrfE family subunit [Acidimicrobiales bacterium]
MNAILGHIGVLLSLAAAGVGIVVCVAGLATKRGDLLKSSRVYAALLLGGAVLATFAMQRALLTHDFSVAFVAENSSRQTPLLYTITGMWSALAGSILLWGLILAGYIVAVTIRFRRKADDPLVGWAMLVLFSVAAFFFALMAGPSDPFNTISGTIPSDGLGPNVLLQDNPLVAIHPPLLYLGFVGFTVPFAFAIASLATGRVQETWQAMTRRWTLLAWAFLTAGILLGAWWSYQVLGWGGFWAWDPVENASLLPWLCATAYLHSSIVQERRGLMRVWNLSLVVSTFCLTILGTFLTRSGVVQSVHAFSDSDIGPLLLGFFGVVFAVGLGLIAWRGDKLRSPGGIDSPLSREGAFILNNLLFATFAFIVLLGTVFPLLYEAFRGTQVTVGAPYFNTMTIPLALLLLTLMAIGPVLPWRKTNVSTLRDRLTIPAIGAVAVVVICVALGVRGLAPLAAFGLGSWAAFSNMQQLFISARASHRHGDGAWRGLVGRANGGMIVHLGIVMVAVAIAAATSFGHRYETNLAVGQTSIVDGHSFEYLGTTIVRTPAETSTEAIIRVDGGGLFHPAVSSFGANTEAVGTPAIDSSLKDDVYLTIDTLPLQVGGPITIGVTIEPLVMWLWVGGGVVVLGAALAVIPVRRRKGRTPTALHTVGEEPTAGGANGHSADLVSVNGSNDSSKDNDKQPVGIPVP